MNGRRHGHGVLALVAVLALAAPVTAQDNGAAAGGAEPQQPETPPAPAARPGFNSPRATLRTFLEAMGQDPPAFEGGVECLDGSGIVKEAANDLALKLYRCINRFEEVRWTDPTIPDEEQAARLGISSWTMFPRDKYRYGTELRRYAQVTRLAPDEKVILARGADNEWRFTAETAEGAEAFWGRVENLPPMVDVEEYVTVAERIKARWPAAFKGEENAFLGVEHWQWISLFALIFAGVVLDFTLRFLLSAISRRIISRQGGEARQETLRRTVRPFGLAAAALLWLWGVRYLDLPVNALKVIMPAVQLFAMLAGVWAMYRVTDLVAEVFTSKAEVTDTKFDDLLVPLVRKTVKIFITVFGLIYIANSLSVPIAPLVTGLGIGGAGFAFAAKDTLEHFFGSVTVIADRPFQVGDWVVIGDTEGTVEEVGFRSTRIRTFYNSLVTVPNGNLVRAVVDNYGLRKYRRWTTHLNITYDTSPENIDAFCEGIREIIRMHPYTRKDYYQVWLHQFAAASLDILVYVFHEAPDWQTELRERHRLMLDIIRLADRLGVDFAFPTQTLHVYQEDASAAHDPAELPEEHGEARAVRAGRRAARELTANAAWRRVRPGPYVFKHAGDDEDDDGTQIESKVGGDA